MAQLAIKAHPTRTKEVIEILEMLGGKNRYHFKGDEDEWFVLNENIQRSDRLFDEKGFTLEDFLEKFPYKVGDKVVHRNSTSCATVYVIKKMRWKNSCVEYTMQPLYEPYSSGVDFAENLRPYEEETMCGELTCNETMCLKVASLKPEKGQIVFGADSPNETELVLGDNFEIKEGNGRAYVVRKQSKYPNTYEECCNALQMPKDESYIDIDAPLSYNKVLTSFTQLLICRDAYWKLAGDWKPYWSIYDHKFCIGTDKDKVIEECVTTGNRILAFPTKEMRDAFYENFKELIELVKELL